MNISEATAIAGPLSQPSKMPGYGYDLPASACQVGMQLVKVRGSTCASCYALKGRYNLPKAANLAARRLASLEHPRWVEAMVALIEAAKLGGLRHDWKRAGQGDVRYFRWHGSGDLQSSDHLLNIAEVARRTPRVRHWLPTREKAILWHVLTEIGEERAPELPLNLVIRLSAAMVDGPPPPGIWPHTSTVHTSDRHKPSYQGRKPAGHVCPASRQGGKCGSCRACWDRRVPNVSYPLH